MIQRLRVESTTSFSRKWMQPNVWAHLMTRHGDITSMSTCPISPPFIQSPRTSSLPLIREWQHTIDGQHPPQRLNWKLSHPQKAAYQWRLRGSTCLPVRRFHVLLNSLFKVLFNFRSRYLFAIGFAVIFSLTRTIPGDLCSRVEEHDSIIVKWARTHL